MSRRQRRGSLGRTTEPTEVHGSDEPETQPEVHIEHGRMLSGPLASFSDFIFSASHPQVFMGCLTTTALLGYHISLRAEALSEITDLPILNFRSTYSPAAAFEYFDALGPEGRAEYQYVNVLSTLLFPLLIAIGFAICIGQVFHRSGLGYEWNLLPFVFVGVSTAENLGIGYLLHSYPKFQPNVAAVVGMLASFKFRLFTYMVLSLVLGLGWWAKSAVQTRVLKRRE